MKSRNFEFSRSAGRSSNRGANLLWRGETGQHLVGEARGLLENGEQQVARFNKLIVVGAGESYSQRDQMLSFRTQFGVSAAPRRSVDALQRFDLSANRLERAAELEK